MSAYQLSRASNQIYQVIEPLRSACGKVLMTSMYCFIVRLHKLECFSLIFNPCQDVT